MQNVTVNIFPSVIEHLRTTSINQSPNETGGVLVGTRSFDRGTLEYNILGCLCVADFEEFVSIYSATPSRFTCKNKDGWAEFALKAVERFGMSYIGDWHTHPRSNMAFLSPIDMYTLKLQYELGQFAPYPPLHLLVQWTSSQDIGVMANVLLGKLLIMVEPNVINNK
mgnify:CR=1 FL=1